jgi:hypothetical protein
MPSIFLSYAREDRAAADRLVSMIKEALGDIEIFQDRSASTFADRTIPPGDWLASIRRELQRCDLVVALVTERYLKSQWLHSEAGGAVLFGKIAIPICFYPVEPSILPSPLSTQSAYVSSSEGLLDFVRALAQMLGFSTIREGHIASLEAHYQTNAAREILGDSENAVRKVAELLDYQVSAGAWLNDLHATFAAESELEAQTTCDNDGRCVIIRRETLIPKSPMAHTFYDVNIDAPGTIRISVSNGDRPTRAVVTRQTQMKAHVAVLFDKIVLPGESIVHTYTVEADNYLSDLVRTGRGQIVFRRHSAALVTSHTNLLRFPKNELFRNVRVQVFDAPMPHQRGEIPRKETEEYYEFEIDLSSSQPLAGLDEIQIQI